MYIVTFVNMSVSYRHKDSNISSKILHLPFIEYIVSAYSICLIFSKAYIIFSNIPHSHFGQALTGKYMY